MDLQKASLIGANDPCSSERNEELFNLVEIINTIREAGYCPNELIVRQTANRDAPLFSSGTNPCCNPIAITMSYLLNLVIRKRSRL